MGYRRGHMAVGCGLAFLMLLAGCAGAPVSSVPPDPAVAPGEPAGRAPQGNGTADAGGTATAGDPAGRASRRLDAVAAVGAGRVWVGGDGFILASADGGATWTEQWRGAGRVGDLEFLDARTGWAVTDRGVMATTDGETWLVVSEQPLDALGVLDATNVYGIAPEGLAVSEDGGRSWAVLPETDGAVAACLVSRAEGWVTDGRTLRRTRDGGATWTDLGGPPALQRGKTAWTGRWVDVACPAGDVLWTRASYGRGAGTEEWAVYRSDDGGENWSLAAGRSQGRYTASVSGPWDVVDAETVLLAGWGADRFTFEGTHDGGRTWEGWLYAPETYTALEPGSRDVTPLCGWPEKLAFGDPQHGWVIDGMTAEGVWHLMRTADGGRTWEPVSVGTAREPTDQASAPGSAVQPSAPDPMDQSPAPEGGTQALAPGPVAQTSASEPAHAAPPTRAELRDRILRELRNSSTALEQILNDLAGRTDRDDEVPWLAADLDGDGDDEYVMALEVQDQHGPWGTGAALFVIYREGDAWAVDHSDPMDPEIERELMAPHLHAAADLTGSGTPQIVWFRREWIATGPQPHFVFVTAWEPGRFTHLTGTMALSNARLALDAADVVLTGISRNNSYLPVRERTDRYRYVNGAFRLVDRRFTAQPEDGYARLWDGLVAEAVGRVEDALTSYREAMDPDRPAHSGRSACRVSGTCWPSTRKARCRRSTPFGSVGPPGASRSPGTRWRRE